MLEVYLVSMLDFCAFCIALPDDYTELLVTQIIAAEQFR